MDRREFLHALAIASAAGLPLAAGRASAAAMWEGPLSFPTNNRAGLSAAANCARLTPSNLRKGAPEAFCTASSTAPSPGPQE